MAGVAEAPYQDAIGNLDAVPLVAPAVAVLDNVAVLDAQNLNGFNDIADSVDAVGREYLTVDQVMHVMMPRVGETVGDYVQRVRTHRSQFLAKLTVTNYGRYVSADTGLDPDRARSAAIATATLIITVITRCMPIYESCGRFFADKQFPNLNEQPTNNDESAVARFAEVFKMTEITSDNMLGTDDNDHPKLNRVVRAGGFTGRVVSTAVAQSLVNALNDPEAVAAAATAGRVALVVGKIMLFRTGHHVQTTSGHMDQIGRILAASGAEDAMRRIMGSSDKAMLAWYRVLAHAFRGWVVRTLLDVFDGTATRALTIRMAGYGAGWARVNVLRAVAQGCGRDRALDGLFRLASGDDAVRLAAIVAGTATDANDIAIGVPDEDTLLSAEYCMVYDAIEPNEGAAIATILEATLRSNATLIQAACEIIGGSLAAARTYTKDARSTRDLRDTYDALRARTPDSLTTATITAALGEAGPNQATIDRIRTAMAPGGGFSAMVAQAVAGGVA